MHERGNRRRYVTGLLVVLVLLLEPFSLAAQENKAADTVIKVTKGSVLFLKDIKSFITSDTIIGVGSGLKKKQNISHDQSVAFYDSLKSRAAKSAITRAIFDMVIVPPRPGTAATITDRSDAGFVQYSGMRIRKIQVKRLNVFGSDISNPGLYAPRTMEKVLNSTHINTNERIIRKNLLFSEGDSVSPLTLSDNERILRLLPYIDDSRIIIVPVSDAEVDIVVVTKDVYSIGADFSYRGKGKGSAFLFDKNIFGMGHEFSIEVPYSNVSRNSPGIGLSYNINNIASSFINLNFSYYDALEKKSYGAELFKELVGSETKWAGGVVVRQTFTEEDLDTMPLPAPLRYNFQDYWLIRSFLVDRKSVSRIIGGIRYVNNNIFEKPEIDPDSYYSLQRFRLYLGSVTWSVQKFYRTNLIYSYGRTEDIPYGCLLRLTGGIEENEFKNRNYLAIDASFGTTVKSIGYINFSAAAGSFLRNGHTEQGLFSLRLKYFSNIIPAGTHKIRNFVNIDYTRGFDRYSDEYLSIPKENGFSEFSNDSIRGAQRVNLSFESVLFSPSALYGFRFAVFGFADAAVLAGTNQYISSGSFVTGIGAGLRIRNDNLVFRTFQIRIGYFPSPPQWSSVNHFAVSGEQLLRPPGFNPGKPATLIFR